jgi:hypothetical protein
MIKYGTDKHHVTLLQELFNFREKDHGETIGAELSVEKGSSSIDNNEVTILEEPM